MSRFTILTVCTGNICRSPLAEQLFQAELAGIAEITLASAGTDALVGRTMDARAAEYSQRYGGNPATHIARKLTEDQVCGADLILAMAREHRRAVVEMTPSALRRTFTLREMARILEEASSEALAEVAPRSADDISVCLRSVVEFAASNRGILGPADAPEDDDIIDPYRRSDQVYEESVAQLIPASRGVALALHVATRTARG